MNCASSLQCSASAGSVAQVVASSSYERRNVASCTGRRQRAHGVGQLPLAPGDRRQPRADDHEREHEHRRHAGPPPGGRRRAWSRLLGGAPARAIRVPTVCLEVRFLAHSHWRSSCAMPSASAQLAGLAAAETLQNAQIGGARRCVPQSLRCAGRAQTAASDDSVDGAVGSVNQKTLPCPGSLSTPMRPPCASTISLQM